MTEMNCGTCRFSGNEERCPKPCADKKCGVYPDWEARSCEHCNYLSLKPNQNNLHYCKKGKLWHDKERIPTECEHFQNRVPKVEVKKNGCGTCERYINSKCKLHKGFSIAMCISKGLKDWKFKVKKKPATCKGCSSLDPHIISRCRRLNVYIGWHWKACQLKNVPLEKTIPVNKVIPIPDDLDIRTATPNEINKYLQEPKKRKRIKDPNELLQRCGGCFHYDLKNVGFFCNKFNKKILQSKTFERWMYEGKKCQHYSKKRNTIPYMRFPETIRDNFIVGFDPSFIDPYMMDHLAVSLSSTKNKTNKQKEVVKKMVNVKEEIEEKKKEIEKVKKEFSKLKGERMKVLESINYESNVYHPFIHLVWSVHGRQKWKKNFLKFLKKNKVSTKQIKKLFLRKDLHSSHIYIAKKIKLLKLDKKAWSKLEKAINKMNEIQDTYTLKTLEDEFCRRTDCYDKLSNKKGICKKCGNPIGKKGKFCKYCGERVG